MRKNSNPSSSTSNHLEAYPSVGIWKLSLIQQLKPLFYRSPTMSYISSNDKLKKKSSSFLSRKIVFSDPNSIFQNNNLSLSNFSPFSLKHYSQSGSDISSLSSQDLNPLTILFKKQKPWLKEFFHIISG